jgi:hypothetical protein
MELSKESIEMLKEVDFNDVVNTIYNSDYLDMLVDECLEVMEIETQEIRDWIENVIKVGAENKLVNEIEKHQVTDNS